jgi:hypothetical protein
MWIFDKSHNPPEETDVTACRYKTHVHPAVGSVCACGEKAWHLCDCGEPAYRLKKNYPICERCDRLEQIGYEEYTSRPTAPLCHTKNHDNYP